METERTYQRKPITINAHRVRSFRGPKFDDSVTVLFNFPYCLYTGLGKASEVVRRVNIRSFCDTLKKLISQSEAKGLVNILKIDDGK